MGLFDDIYLNCPDCGQPVRFQSKAGECVLATFHEDAVPVKIAHDILGETAWCDRCKRRVTAALKPPEVLPETVAMRAE